MTPNEPDDRYRRLSEVCRSLGRSEDVEHFLHKIVAATCELTNSLYSFILVYEQETDLLKIVAGPASHRDMLKHIRVPLEKSLAGWVYSHTRYISLHDAQDDARIFREIERTIGYETHSILAVPLVFRGETIGVLEAVNKQNHTHYTEEDQTILETLASQAAVATLSTLLFEETKQAYDEVKELERMKSDFIAVASHELRTPLGLILGHATFMRELIHDVQQEHQLDLIIRNATRLKTIIDDLSNIRGFQSGITKIQKKQILINHLIKKILSANLESAKQKKIILRSTIPENHIMIEGDEEKLGIAFNNLVLNGIIYTNEGGSVTVAIEPLPGYVQVSVIDDGIGIPAKDLPHIFDRFFQVQSHLTRSHGGLGLGLSVAKAMVEMHQGQLWAESVEGKGSKFFVLLPISPLDNPSKVQVFHS